MTSVLVDKRNDITVVTINRPEVRNAVDGPAAEALALYRHEHDHSHDHHDHDHNHAHDHGGHG